MTALASTWREVARLRADCAGDDWVTVCVPRRLWALLQAEQKMADEPCLLRAFRDLEAATRRFLSTYDGDPEASYNSRADQEDALRLTLRNAQDALADTRIWLMGRSG